MLLLFSSTFCFFSFGSSASLGSSNIVEEVCILLKDKDRGMNPLSRRGDTSCRGELIPSGRGGTATRNDLVFVPNSASVFDGSSTREAASARLSKLSALPLDSNVVLHG